VVIPVDGRPGTACPISPAPPVHHLAVVDGRLMMYGGQEGRRWSAVVLGETGRLSAGVVDHEGGFLIFGACTTP
jgi:hypothetical protein